MVKIKIKYNGRKVTLRGVGFGRYHNLILAQTGLRAVRRRLSRGIGADGSPMPPLDPKYAKRKKHSSIRDLWFTGQMLRNLSVRWASPRAASIALTSRKSRAKGIRHQKFRQWLGWAPQDKKAVITRGKELFKTEVTELDMQLKAGTTDQNRGRRPWQSLMSVTGSRRFQTKRATGLRRAA